jgi:hypothetical protein
MTRVILIWVFIFWNIIRLASINVRVEKHPNSVFSGQDAIDQLVEDWSVLPFIELRVE